MTSLILCGHTAPTGLPGWHDKATMHKCVWGSLPLSGRTVLCIKYRGQMPHSRPAASGLCL